MKEVRLKIELLDTADMNTPAVRAFAVTLRGERAIEHGSVCPGIPGSDYSRICVVSVDEYTDVVLRLVVPPMFLKKEDD